MSLFGKSEKENIFFTHLNNLSAKTLDCFLFLEKSVTDPQDLPEARETLKGMRRDINEIHNIILDDLHNSFITPIDREDIFNLSHSLSELARYTYSTMDELVHFEVEPDEAIRKMVKLARKQADELRIATERLAKNPRVATEHLNQIRIIEEDIEKTYRKALYITLQEIHQENYAQSRLRREVYRHIANMSDKAVSAAKTMGMIVMKLS